MITSGAVVPSLPTLVHKVTQVIQHEAQRLGLGCSVQLHTGVSHGDNYAPNEYFCVLTFTIITILQKKEANVQIVYSGWNPESSARILSASGFPEQLQHLVHNLQANAPAGGNATGVSAVKENDPPKAKRGKRLAAEAKAPDTFSVAVNALFDIVTLKEEAEKNEPPRAYIGASSIANDCHAYQALSMRGFPSDTPSPQLIRIFNEGHRVEAYVVEMLKKCGHKVEEVNPATGKQWNYASKTGRIKCNLDGYITPVGSDKRMTLEVKSMNRDKFKAFKEKGLALSHPDYVVQVQLGMALAVGSGAEFAEQCFFIAYCKDNQQFHVEVIDYDANHESTIDAVARVTSVVIPSSGHAAKRNGSYENEYECSQCFKRSSCWKPEKFVEKRTCLHCERASLRTNHKQWICTLKHVEVDEGTPACDEFAMFRVMRSGK